VASPLITDLPFFDDERSLRIPQGPALRVLHNQIVVWVSLTPRHAPYDAVPVFPSVTRRFPAVLDCGYNDSFMLNERHVTDWALLDPHTFPVLGLECTIRKARDASKQYAPDEDSSRTVKIPYREGWLWLHRPKPGFRDEVSEESPERLFLPPGFVIVPEDVKYLSFPLLGMRTVRNNRLLVAIDGARGAISIAKADS
jgi:hypothetical protein